MTSNEQQPAREKEEDTAMENKHTGVHAADEMPEEEQPPSKRQKMEKQEDVEQKKSAAWRIPTALICHILQRTAESAYRPTIWVRQFIHQWCLDVRDLALVCKAARDALKPLLKRIRRIDDLLRVFPDASSEFDRDRCRPSWPDASGNEGVVWFYPLTREIRTVYASSILIEVFQMGTRLYNDFDGTESPKSWRYTALEEICQLMPEAVHCRRGWTYSFGGGVMRSELTPFVVGARNSTAVAVADLEVLLRHGADPWPTLNFNRLEIDLLQDLRLGSPPTTDPGSLFNAMIHNGLRADAIEALLKPYQDAAVAAGAVKPMVAKHPWLDNNAETLDAAQAYIHGHKLTSSST